MRDLYARHKTDCGNAAKPNGRKIFNCACPLYARFVIKSPVTGSVLFEHNGSLAKFGVTTKEKAEALLDQWMVSYLTGIQPSADEQRNALTVEDAVNEFAKYKASRRGKESDAVRKIMNVLGDLPKFCTDRKIKYLEDVELNMLVDFEDTWPGQRVKNSTTGEWSVRPKTNSSKQKYQEVLCMMYKHWHNLGKIRINVAAQLEPFEVPKSEIHVYTAEQVLEVFKVIPETFPKIAANVEAFMLVQAYSGLRLSDMVTLEVATLKDDGFQKDAQQKTDNAVYCPLPPWVVAKLRAVTPKSEKYFFWTGNGKWETATTDWSDYLLRVFRAAKVPEGFRSHAFRDTLATTILENGGTLEDAQIALGHKSRKTTERYYIKLTKKRAENVTKIKHLMWESDTLYNMQDK